MRNPLNQPRIRTLAIGMAFSACTVLTLPGCGPERAQPEDLPRRERSEVFVATPDTAKSPAKSPAETPASAPPNAASIRDDAFREAAVQGDLPEVKKRVSEGSLINAEGAEGRTALQLACFDGHLETVEWLIEQDAEIDHHDDFGRTALMYAATGDNAATVKALLAAGADVGLIEGEEHFTALMYAAAEGQAEVVRILLDAGADATRQDIDGETAIDFARANGHNDVVQMLSQPER